MRSASQQQGGGPIMSSNNKEDDEDELEALRLAALESLRAKGLPPPVVVLPGQRVSPKPNFCSNAVFQRHLGNQNLIAIIPVEQSSATSASSSPFQNSSPHHPPFLESKSAPPPTRNSGRPPLLRDPLPNNFSAHNSPVEEKSKHTTKFSRFDDSDSDESDDMSFAKSDSDDEDGIVEREEIIIEEGDEEDFIIEVEEEIVEEHEVIEPDVPVSVSSENEVKQRECDKKTVEQSLSPVVHTNTFTPPPKTATVDAKKEEPPQRDSKGFVGSKRIDSGDFAKRSPKTNSTRSPQFRRRSPPRTQRTPPRLQKSPPRVQRSPQRNQRSPPPRGPRSPTSRAPKSPMRVQRSPSRRSPPRSQRSPVRSSDRSGDRVKMRDSGSKPGSGSERQGSDEEKKFDRRRVGEANNGRSLDQRRTSDKAPLCEKKTKKSPPPPRQDSDDTKKVVTLSLSDAERDRLESRKRKFELAPAHDIPLKKEGKIRLRTESNQILPKRSDDKPKRMETDETYARRVEDATIIAQDKTEKLDSNRKLKSNARLSNKNGKEKNRKRNSHSNIEQDNVVTLKLPVNKTDDSSDAQLDLRAELQRRRGHRAEDDEEPRSRTPETRRILVLNSPPSSSAVVPPPKPTSEPTGVLSKRLISDCQSKTSDLVASSKRNGSVKLKRTLLATPIEVDQGPETDPLEDRIRLIRAQNELIRKRQLEIEADKLQYA